MVLQYLNEQFWEDLANAYKLRFVIVTWDGTAVDQSSIQVIYDFGKVYDNLFYQNHKIRAHVNEALDKLHKLMFEYCLDTDKILNFPFDEDSLKDNIKILRKAIQQYEREHKMKFREYFKYQLGIKKYSKYESVDLLFRLLG